MSIATQRAKERENRTPDVKVMGKTVKHRRLISTGVGHPGLGPDFRGCMSRTVQIWCSRSQMSGLGPRCPADGPDVRPEARMSGPTIPDRDLDFETRFGAEMDDFGGKI